MHDDKITYFGETDYRNKRQRFGIKSEDRTKHMYVIGKSGMGKSTTLENMAAQDIQNGNGLAFIDPHGASAEALLEYVPEDRIDDVIYFAPHDLEYPISFNIMEDIGYDKRHLVVAGLMSTFEKIWADAWSARMAYILQNTLLALLEYPGATLLGVNRMYIDKAFRDKVVSHVTDPATKSFWVDEFAGYTDRFAAEATPAIQNKVGQFTSNPLIRNIIGQPHSSFNMRDIMDNKKILIVNLSKGQVGEANVNLLGSMLVTKLYLAALTRADVSKDEMAKLPNFYLYVDEFQSFANKSFADILAEARKYKLNLTIAHQYVEQMPEEVRAAVFGNVGTMVTFRIGATDAEVFEKEFAPQFMAEDFVNLGRFQMYLKLMVDEVSSAPFSANSLPPLEQPRISYRDIVIARSREQYAHKRTDVEEEIQKWHEARVEEEGASKNNKSNKNKKGSTKGDMKKALSKMAPAKTQEERETQLRKAMSLEDLKPQKNKSKQKKKKDTKGPTQAHINDLRAALKDVLTEEGVVQDNPKHKKKANVPPPPSMPPVQKNPFSPVVKKQPSSEVPQDKPKSEEEKKEEVPEHVLKKLLEMEE